MFDFLFQKNNGLQSLAETITIELEKLNIAKLAVEKAETMIAKAIAKSDILIQTQSEDKRKYEYRLNVQPNDNENGTYFWTKVVKKLLREGEVVIIRIGEKYYRAQSFQESDNVMTGRLYSNITIEAAEKQYSLFKTFLSGDVIHLRYDNSKIRVLLNSVLSQYETTANSVNAMMQIANTPKFKLKVPGQLNLVRRGKDGESDKKITKEEYTEELKKLLESESLAIITESNGITLEQLGIQTATKAEELVKIKEEINNATAEAYDIPQAVFNGNITEKSDATNEFITYAVGSVAEVINDELTAKLVGAEDYAGKNERVMVWLARFKHVDVVDSANNLDKLRSNGWNFDEIREMVGYPVLNTPFSQARALTKNYTTGEEDHSNAETS
ncbi:phage portal protein [Dorea longicatena]|uniref:phage portal protein n=1 Tax=Dorea longicatena TaxID=88431 RepID=UPI003F8CBEC5